MPFTAILAGRNRLTAADMPWAAIVVGLAMAIALFVLHPMFFGGNPLG
jgi:uncharacterized membrane protein